MLFPFLSRRSKRVWPHSISEYFFPIPDYIVSNNADSDIDLRQLMSL